METGDDVLDEGRARGQREQLGQDVPERVADRDGTVRPADRDVRVDTEAVVPPDDVAEDLVVPPVVGRVDDPLVLPAAPRVRSRRGELHADLVREAHELRAAVRRLRRRLGEGVAPAGAHLDLGRDQLADEIVRERAGQRSGLQLLEPIRQLERLGIEHRELLLDGEGEVGAAVERVACVRQQLLPRDALLVAHSRER